MSTVEITMLPDRCAHCGTKLADPIWHDGAWVYDYKTPRRWEAEPYEDGGVAAHGIGRCRSILQKRLDQIRDVVFTAAAEDRPAYPALAQVATLLGMKLAAGVIAGRPRKHRTKEDRSATGRSKRHGARHGGRKGDRC